MSRTDRPCRPRLECLEDRAVPTTFTVNTTLDVVNPADGRLSLREAITRANNHAGADVVVVPAGVYKIALAPAHEDLNAGGDFDVTGSVTIRGAGAGATVIDGQRLDRVLDVRGTEGAPAAVILQGLTVRNGELNTDGGGVRVQSAGLVVRACAVTGNRGTTGGGISSTFADGAGDVTLIRSTVSRNVAVAGGGLAVLGAGNVLTLRNSTVRRNVAEGSSGGGVVAETAFFANSTVSGNTASDRGGGVRGGRATLTNCTVSGNTSFGDGGGISTNGAVTLTGCTVTGNSATADGGGIKAGAANLTNCTVSGNSAAANGGGIHASTANLLNCTVVENLANTGGGLFHEPGGAFGLKNSIVALNLATYFGSDPDVSGFFASGGHNLIGYGTAGGGFVHGVNGEMVGTAANRLNPKLGPLANNGGPTQTHALLAGSRAIDRGDNAGALATDQRGLPRRKDGNGDGRAVVDIGAFER